MSKLIELIRESLRGEENNFTKGSLNRSLVLLAIPMMLEMVMESIFALVDAYFVAKISSDALATVGITESVITLVYAVAIGLSMAPVAMISRFIGKDEPEQAARAARQTIYLGLAVSFAIGIPGFFFAEDILRLMGGSPELIATGRNYTRILFASNFVIMLLFLLNGIFRGAGEAARAMKALWLANGLNIILDPLLIFGIGPFPELGVAGAAVATSIGRGVGVAYQLYILLSGKSVVRLSLGSWRIDWNMIRRLGRIAATGAMQFIIASASWIFLMRIIAGFGSTAVAGYTIAIRLVLFTLLPGWGLANAAATLVGQNLGAKQARRAEQSVWRAAHVNAVYLFFVSLTYIFFPEFLIRFFTDDPTTIQPGIVALRIFGIGYVIYGYGTILSQAFNGAGDTRTPTLINLVCFWMFEIPLGYYLGVSLDWGVAGVTWAVVSAETLMALLAGYLFYRGRWKLVEV